MKVGDLVKHQYGTIQGTGIILSIRPFDGKRARTLWTAHCQSKIHEVLTRYLEVVREAG
jgi:hypothetical protein